MTLGRHRRTVVIAAAVVAALVTARLGVWQLDRAQQKIDRQRSLDERAQLPPLPGAELARRPEQVADQLFRRTELQGRWLAERTVYLDNRQMNGRPGFFVMTPLLLTDGDAVLVQRGWLPRDFTDRNRLAPLATPPGVVQVTGRVSPPPSKLFEFQGADTGAIRQNLDLVAYSREIRVALRPVTLLQTAPERAAMSADIPAVPPAVAASDTLLRQWAAPTVDVGKHHGYAFQWFALCALITGLTLWFQIIRPRVHTQSQPPDR